MLLFFLSAVGIADEPSEKLKSTLPTSSEEDVATLIEQAKGGDNDAFSSLVGLFERFVFNTACRVLSASGSSTDAADDISQDAFIKAWRSLKFFRGDCSFSTWLFRITVNTARDTMRAASRRNTISLSRDSEDDGDSAEWDVPVTEGDTVPEDACERKERILGVRRAIEELPEEQRVVVVMRDIHELTYQEIADTLGLELGTVKSRLNRARANLKTILKNGNFL